MRLRPTPLALALAVALPAACAEVGAQVPPPKAAVEAAGTAPPVLKLATELTPPPLRAGSAGGGVLPGTAAKPSPAPPRVAPAAPGAPAAGGAAGEGPIFLRADRLDGVAGKFVEAEGKVELRTRSETVLAEWLRYDFDIDEVWGKGGVLLRRGGDSISGPEAKFKRDTSTGYFTEPRFILGTNGGRGSAATLTFDGPERFEVTDGRYTTCVAPNQDWYVRMDELEIDQRRRVGSGRNATVRFFDVPIAYSPWFEFPLDNQRKSGFLVPTLGATGIRGFEAAVPYYFNLAPNYDATLTPRLMTKRGLQLGGQGRYLFETFAGELNAEFLPNDRQTGTDRWGVSFRHNQNLDAITPGLAGYLNFNKVSDDTYFADLADRIAVTSQSSLPREGGFTWSRGPWQALARAQSFQTLQDPGSPPVTPPYNRLPQLAGRLLETDWLGLSFDGTGEYVHYRQSALTPTGERMYVYPGVAWNRQGAAWSVTARAAVHARKYWLDGATTSDSAPSVVVPIASVDGGLVFERDWNVYGRDFLQTLEPRAFYVYIPYRNQNSLPNFDSAEDDFNFAQLFSVNRYLGNDRIGDANQLTLALTSRLFESATGAERLRVAVGQRFYFRGQQVTLGNETPQAAGTSDLLALAEGRITDAWALAGLVQYNFDSSQTERFDIGLRWTPGPGRVVNASYRYDLDNENAAPGTGGLLKQFDISAQWPISARWTMLGRWNYSLADSKNLEAVLGVEYNADCWSLRFALQRLTTTTETVATSVYAQIELNGLARFGTSPLDLMRRSVPGYQQSNDPTINPRERGDPFPDY